MERNLVKLKDAWLSNTKTPAEQHHQPQEKPRSLALHVDLKLGWDLVDRKSVTLKTFRTDPFTFEDHPCHQLVEYEIKSMDRTSSHHNIVRLNDVVVKSPSHFCLVMEAAAASQEGLMETITAAPQGRLGHNEAGFYLGQLLDAVQHCHANGVCHRDIQPKNLLVDSRSGNMKLSNFGRAGLWDTMAGISTDFAYAPSTAPLAYAAPEVLTGSKYCGKAADCWSTGAILFTMLAGFSPVKTDEAEVGDNARYFEPPPWISPLARSLLGGMMEPNPDKRYTMEEIRSHTWFALTRGDDGGNHGSSSSDHDRIKSIRSISSISSISSGDGIGCRSNDSGDRCGGPSDMVISSKRSSGYDHN